MRWLSLVGFAIVAIGAITFVGCGEEKSIVGVVAEDAPNDAGKVINVQWAPHPDEADGKVAGYSITRTAPDGTKEEVGQTGPGELMFMDEGI
ncbi:MAG: hypothetical protein GY771_14000, partial [bacterium]|nr:hypothetical protein [bacterium]